MYCVSLKQALEIIPVFKDIESIRYSRSSNPFDEWPFFLWQKSSCSHTFFHIYFIFSEQKDLAKKYHSYQLWYLLDLGMFKLKHCLLFDDINCSNPFLLSVIISQKDLKRSIMSRTTIHYSKRSVVDSRKFEGYCVWFFEENHCSRCSFKSAYLFHRTSCYNFCLHPSCSFMVNVLIWQIHNRNCSSLFINYGKEV